jgi:hypothetical protein
MLERKTVKYKFNLTAVALANKVARIVFRSRRIRKPDIRQQL